MQNSLAYLTGKSRTCAVFFQVSQTTTLMAVLAIHNICREVSKVSHSDYTFVSPGIYPRSGRQPQPFSFSQPESWSTWESPFPSIPPFPWPQQQPRCWNSSPCKDPSPLFCFYLSCLCPCDAQNWSTQDNEATRFANNSPPSHSVLASLSHTNSTVSHQPKPRSAMAFQGFLPRDMLSWCICTF